MGPRYANIPLRGWFSLEPFIQFLQRKVEKGLNGVFYSARGLLEVLEQTSDLRGTIDELAVLHRHQDVVDRVMGMIFPSVFWETEAFAMIVPFTMEPVGASPEFKRLFLDQGGAISGRLEMGEEMFARGRLIQAYIFILSQFYDIEARLDYPLLRIVSDPDTGLDRHFKMNLDLRFVEAHAEKAPKKLTPKEKAWISEHLTEPEALQEFLPLEDFSLQGFTCIQAVEVTESQVLAGLERNLVDQEALASKEGFLKLQDLVRTLFRRPDLTMGLAALQEDQVLLLNAGCEISESRIFVDSHHIPMEAFKGSIFEKAVETGEVVRVPDVHSESDALHKVNQELLEAGIRSLMVAPLLFQGVCIGTLDVGSPRPHDLGAMDALKLQQLQPIFAMAVKKALEELEHEVQGLIKEKCTAIHPTVEWRFRKAAFRYLENQRLGRPSEIEPIVFRDVYPLYGTADIRGSSTLRNQAIQEDLTEHLKLALHVISAAQGITPMLILEELAQRIESHMERLQTSLRAGDEFAVVRFLQEEVEPVFSNLAGLGERTKAALDRYQSAVDAQTGTVYVLRNQLERSASTLTDRLTRFLDQEETSAQGIFPHYFERHRTDGVDYLIYIGNSLSQSGGFSRLFLRNLRLWQLQLACGMVWHTERLRSAFRVPLETAHLVLVQDTPLSIRFRYDEKRFDVDGAYDVRQEIIKSRLDKATVKGSGERLTQPRKVAVVYSQPEEGEEMRRHIDFLRSQGFLDDQEETLELEDMPGVYGLKALRVSVNLESERLSQKAALKGG